MCARSPSPTRAGRPPLPRRGGRALRNPCSPSPRSPPLPFFLLLYLVATFPGEGDASWVTCARTGRRAECALWPQKLSALRTEQKVLNEEEEFIYSALQACVSFNPNGAMAIRNLSPGMPSASLSTISYVPL